ncbi:MAG TPA: hypothetical protein VMH86_14380 [Rhizomicrobium sp.]|nr:hypothetical protein [Rhizomicrobium sp.]
MAPHKRILMLGPTGVDKSTAAKRLAARVKDKFNHEIRFVDFEKEYLKPELERNGIRNWFTFLAQDGGRQAIIWQAAWSKLPKFEDQITILGLHACYVSGIVGLRCPVNLPGICADFRPTLIVTLIDDVQNMWTRTELRAGGRDSRGRPSFEQLLTARRAEQLLGDMLVSHSQDPNVRHVLLASSNALTALVNLIVWDSKVTYLSFPISAPRRMERDGDSSFTELINRLHHAALVEMERDTKRSFITPLAIDELPLVFKWKDAQVEKAKPSGIPYCDLRDRWLQSDLWGGNDLAVLPPLGASVNVPSEQIEVVAGIVETDVGWRDRRLVLQAQSLAIFCPKDPKKDRITRGVKTELEAATAVGISSFYWQNPVWDPGDFVSTQFEPAGSMGLGATEALVQRTESLEALIRAQP